MKNNIKELLAEKGMKQRQLAAACEIDTGQLNKIILCKTVPGIALALKIAKALDVKVEDVWGGEEE